MAAAAGISEAARERRIKSGGEWRGEGEEEKRGEDDADKDEGKDKEEQEETTRRSIPPPGYCIRIYYNLRIPEEEKDCEEGLGRRDAPFRRKRDGRGKNDEEDHCA